MGIILPEERKCYLKMENDNIKLLRECDAGVEMGMSSIDDVLPYVKAENFKNLLTNCKEEHEKLEREIRALLRNYGDEGKDPNPKLKKAVLKNEHGFLKMSTKTEV